MRAGGSLKYSARPVAAKSLARNFGFRSQSGKMCARLEPSNPRNRDLKYNWTTRCFAWLIYLAGEGRQGPSSLVQVVEMEANHCLKMRCIQNLIKVRPGWSRPVKPSQGTFLLGPKDHRTHRLCQFLKETTIHELVIRKFAKSRLRHQS